MREKVTKVMVYQFDELSEQAQQKALERLWDLHVEDSYWYDFITEDIKEFGKVSGVGCEYGREFDCDRANYISITDLHTTVSTIVNTSDRVKYEYPNVWQEVIAPFLKSFTPKELYQIKRLEKAQILGALSGHTSQQRRAQRTDVERYDTSYTPRIRALIDSVEVAWSELVRDLEYCYVKMLRDEYEYQTSAEQIIESIRANEYEFTENGDLA